MLKGKVCRHGVKMNGKYGNTERQLLMFFEKCACEGKQRAREIVGEWIISKKKEILKMDEMWILLGRSCRKWKVGDKGKKRDNQLR